MTRMMFVLGATVLLAACDGTATPAPTRLPSASPTPPLPPVNPVVQMVIGEEVEGTFSGAPLMYEFTAPADGWLVATLKWDARSSLLTLSLGSAEHKGNPPFWSPLEARWPVKGRETYRLIVGPGGTDWLYEDPFVLTTRMDP